VSLVFSNASPDAIRLVESQRVVEALHDDGALGAQSSGALLSLVAFEPTFSVGVEEHRWVCSAAQGGHLPTPGLGVPGDRWSRCACSVPLARPNLVHGPLLVAPTGGVHQFEFLRVCVPINDLRSRVFAIGQLRVSSSSRSHFLATTCLTFVSVDELEVAVRPRGDDLSQGPTRHRAFAKAATFESGRRSGAMGWYSGMWQWRRRFHRRRHRRLSVCSARRSRRSSHLLRLLPACVLASRVHVYRRTPRPRGR